MKTIGIGEKTKVMNIITARAEAKRRWGITSFATVSRIHKTADKKGWMKGVGKRNWKTDTKDLFGWGETWEEAFDQATKKGK